MCLLWKIEGRALVRRVANVEGGPLCVLAIGKIALCGVELVREDKLHGLFVKRDLMLIGVQAETGEKRSEIRELAEIFRGKIVVLRNEMTASTRSHSYKIDP